VDAGRLDFSRDARAVFTGPAENNLLDQGQLLARLLAADDGQAPLDAAGIRP
jgi:hypothetical protein